MVTLAVWRNTGVLCVVDDVMLFTLVVDIGSELLGRVCGWVMVLPVYKYCSDNTSS